MGVVKPAVRGPLINREGEDGFFGLAVGRFTASLELELEFVLEIKLPAVLELQLKLAGGDKIGVPPKNQSETDSISLRSFTQSLTSYEAHNLPVRTFGS